MDKLNSKHRPSLTRSARHAPPGAQMSFKKMGKYERDKYLRARLMTATPQSSTDGMLFVLLLLPCLCSAALPRVLESIPEYCISSRWGFSCFEARAGPLARLGALQVRQMVGRSVLATAGLVVGREIIRDCAENRRLLRETRGLAGIEGTDASVVLGQADDEPAPAAEVTDESPSSPVESLAEPDGPVPSAADPLDTADEPMDTADEQQLQQQQQQQQYGTKDEKEAAAATSSEHSADASTTAVDSIPELDKAVAARKRPREVQPRGRRRSASRAAAAWDPGWE